MSTPVHAAIAESLQVPLLVVVGGLPGTGKTTIARGLATHLSAVHLRVDTVEQVLRRAPGGPADLTDLGYRVLYALALDNLQLGHWVIADAVNPVPLTRGAWRAVAEAARAAFVEIELVCSDPAEHRRRVERRAADIPGLELPTWQDVLDREYHPWQPTVRIDTAGVSADDSIREAITAVMHAQAGSR